MNDFTDNTENLIDSDSQIPGDASVNADASVEEHTDSGMDVDADANVDADAPALSDASDKTGDLEKDNFDLAGESPAPTIPVQDVPFEEWAEPTPAPDQSVEVTPTPIQLEPTPTPTPIIAAPIPDQSGNTITPEQLQALTTALENADPVSGDSSETYNLDDIYILLSDWVDWQKEQAETQQALQDEEKEQEQELQAQLAEYRDYMTQQSQNIFSANCLIFLSIAFLSGILFARVIWRKL